LPTRPKRAAGKSGLEKAASWELTIIAASFSTLKALAPSHHAPLKWKLDDDWLHIDATPLPRRLGDGVGHFPVSPSIARSPAGTRNIEGDGLVLPRI